MISRRQRRQSIIYIYGLTPLSSADHVPTLVLKQIADIVAPFIVQLFNRSLCKGLSGYILRGFYHTSSEEART